MSEEIVNVRMKGLSLKKAETLFEIRRAFKPTPLITDEEFTTFYEEGLNEVRGNDKIESIAAILELDHRAGYYKTFLIGHSGVGKSTELTRLCRIVDDKFVPIRFSAQEDLDASGFRPFDVFLMMMILLTEEMQRRFDESCILEMIPEELLEQVHGWYDVPKTTTTKDNQFAGSAEAGIGLKSESFLAKVTGLFANVKTEIKYVSDQKTEVTEYRLHTIGQLLNLLNWMLDSCNEALFQKEGKEWLFIGEDFDKPGIPPNLTETLFIQYSNLFKDLRAHAIFTLPIEIAYSDRQPRLSCDCECILDTPVYRSNHTPHEEGREALRRVLKARIDLNLFEDGQADRLIVASGGNLRDLFELVSDAATEAIVRGRKAPKDATDSGKIEEREVTYAINQKRIEYRNRLGQTSTDPKELTYDVKAELLKQTYLQGTKERIPNPVMHSLLRAKALQEFNGEGWFGVHPLVVDLLIEQKVIEANAEGKYPGGTI